MLERVVYENTDTGFTIARVSTQRSGPELLTVVGSLLGAQVGECLRLTGHWSRHPKYGRQFLVHSFTSVLPATIQGIRRYLGSGLIKGIGPMIAERMVAHFGAEILRIIEEQPSRLSEVRGLGPKRTTRIAEAWAEQKAIKEVMVFLAGIGVSTSLAARIYKRYRDDSIAVVRENPYRLASEVWGIGFKTADAIAKSIGIAEDSPERLKAGLQYALSEAAENGHCHLPQQELIEQAAKILDVEPPLLLPCIEALVAQGGVIREVVAGRLGAGNPPAALNTGTGEPVTAVYLVPFHQAERLLADRLLQLLRSKKERMPTFLDVKWQRAFLWLRQRTGQELVAGQRDAVQLALSSRVAVLTGGPGCGKSFTVRSVVALARAKGATVALVAPTGRAAKRLAELTGHPASTVHRLLELKPTGDPRYHRDNPLDADLVVVDECSMMDVLLANKLLRAIPDGAHLLLVGDVDQLPSVGAGEVLRELIASATIPTVRLTQIFRQAQQSGIVVNAHRINDGKSPHLRGFPDFHWFDCDPSTDSDSDVDPAQRAATLLLDIVVNRIPAKFGLHPVHDIQVLTPMHRGAAGAGSLNSLLQEALNPERAETVQKRFGEKVFRLGDKVIQLRNNYSKGTAGIFNGTVGTVSDISLEEQSLIVRTDEDEAVPYDFAELHELAHAYAITIHRSQGSEYPAVVIPLTTSSWIMLQRNLLYTGITRARRLVVLVGSRRALAKAVRTPGAGRRHTALAHRLQASA